MRAYNSDSHAGLVVGFNENHPLFAGSCFEVEYSDTPFKVSANDGWVWILGATIRDKDILESKLKAVPFKLFTSETAGLATRAGGEADRPPSRRQLTPLCFRVDTPMHVLAAHAATARRRPISMPGRSDGFPSSPDEKQEQRSSSQCFAATRPYTSAKSVAYRPSIHEGAIK
jgi:hypothetical protein